MARLLSFLLVLVPFLIQAEESIRKTSRVQQVTLYPSAAEVIRETKLDLEKGVYELIFPGLSNQLYDQSFQVSAQGDYQIMSISSRLSSKDGYKQESKYIRLAHELEQLDHKIHGLQSELKALSGEEHLLGENKSLGGTQGIDLQKLQSVSTYYRKRLEEINLRKYAIQKEQQSLSQKRSDVQNAINKFIAKINGQGKELVLKIESAKAQRILISFSYLINQQVSWQDNYDLYFEDLKQDLRLHHKAIVRQSTGEDWENVKLSFSTGYPNMSGSLPAFSPYFLNTYYPTKRSPRAYAMEDTESMSVQSTSKDNKAGNASFRPISIQDRSLSKTYHLAGKHTILSGTEENIHLEKMELQATFVYRAIPKLNEHVFLEALVKNWEDLELSAGEVLVYNQGSFINRFFFNSVNQKEMRLSLGIDPQLNVKRDKVKDQESSKLFGSTIKKTFNYRLSAKSLKDEAVELVILDQIPISRNDKVKVEILEMDGAILNREKGELKWKFDLDAKGSKEVRFGYEISHPKDLPVVN